MDAGKRFGRLVSIRFERKSATGAHYWRFACDCGKETVARLGHVRDGRSQSCGCLRREISTENSTTHGLSKTRAYPSWMHAKKRCEDPKNRAYKNYGGRGIQMCDSWRDAFEAFFADMGECPPGLTLERIENDGPYSKENCRWATRREQAANTRLCVMLDVNGVLISRATYAHRHGITSNRLKNIIRERGLSPKEAVRYALSHKKRATLQHSEPP